MKTSAGTNVTTGVGLAQRLFSRVLNAVSTVLQPAADMFSAQGRTVSCVPGDVTSQFAAGLDSGRARLAMSFMAVAMFIFTAVALLAPRTVEARAAILANYVANYSGSKLTNLCGNCHVDWGGGGIGNVERIDVILWDVPTAAAPAGSQFYLNDSDMDTASTGTELTQSQSGTRANRWFPSYPDKDGDGCIQIFNKLGESGTFDAPVAFDGNAGVGDGSGFITYGPQGWDTNDNDAALGCSTPLGTWSTTGNNMVKGAAGDSVLPGAISDFRAIINATSAVIPLAWTATGDDGATGLAHDYDIRYMVNPTTITAGRNPRLAADWLTMYRIAEAQMGNPPSATWNQGTGLAPLRRAMYEPIPTAPGATQACNALGYSALCTANAGASYVLGVKGGTNTTNVIANGTTYWLANQVSDGVVNISGTFNTPGTFTENSTLSNIIAVTAGPTGITATSGVAITSVSPALLTGTTSPATVTVTGYGLNLNANQVVNMYLTNSAGTAVAQATGLSSNGTTLTGVFTAPITAGTYTLEVRNGTGLANVKAARVNAVTVDASFAGNNPPVISLVSPNSRGQGAVNQNIVITGTFLTGGVVSFSGTGITINSQTVNSDTQITANISIAAAATTGARTLTVTTGAPPAATATFTIVAAPTLTCSPPAGQYGVSYSHTCTATAGVSWAATGVPTGVTFTNGAYSGTPTAVGTFTGAVTVTDPSTGGQNSVATSIVISATAPGAPTIGTITPASGQVTVTYTAPTNTGGSAITNYSVTCTPSGTVTVANVLTATVTGLTNGTPYTCSVRAINGIGTSAASGSLTATPGAVPGAPTGLAVVVGNGSCTVNFTAPANNGATITSYTGLSTPGSFTGITNGNPASPTVTVSGLTNGTSYTFTVRATNSFGQGAASAPSPACVPQNVTVPPTVTAQTVTITGSTTATLGATVTNNGGAAITARGTCWGTTPAPTTNCLAEGGTAVGTPFSHARTGLVKGVTYYYRGYATNAATPTPLTGYSADGTFTTWTEPGAPTAVTATATSGTAVSVAYTEPTFTGGVGATITSYTATCTSSDGGATPAPVTDNAAPFTAISLSGLTSGKTYTCAVVAANSVGSSTAGTSASLVMPGVPTLADPTSMVTGTGVTALLGATITSNGGSAITERGTCWGTAAAPTTNCLAEGGTAVGVAYSHSRSGFVAGTTYTYRGYAVSAAGTGYSPDAQFTTWSLPGAPTIGTCTVASATSATCSFTPPASDGGTAITGYTVTSNPGSFTGVGAASPITVTGLTTNTSYTFTVRATNSVGTGNPSAASNSVYVSNDSIPPTVTATPPGGSYVGTQNVTLTADEPATIYYTVNGSTPTTSSTVYTAPIAVSSSMILKFFGKDTAGNESAVSTETYIISSADLIMDTVTKTATSVHVNTSFSVDNAVRNQGGTSAGTSYVKFYLSLDPTITTADIAMTGSRYVPALASLATSTSVSTTVTVPKTVAPGTYTVGACADVPSAVAETSETNNCLGAGFITVIRQVDLVMTSVGTTTTSVSVGATMPIDSTELNQGATGMTAASNFVKFYLSTDSTITTTDVAILASRFVAALGAGASSSGTTTVTVPKGMVPGTYYVGACADGTYVQVETIETNNCLASTATVTITRNVDLVITAGSVSTAATTASVATTISVDSTEQNAGSTNMTVASNFVRFYLSLDTNITAADIALTGTRFVPALAAGASNTGSATVTVPKTMNPGTYYLGACADSSNGQPETNETNNCTPSAATITITRNVDLVISDASKTATSVGAGEGFSIDSTETNSGTTPMTVPSNYVKFYLSVDATCTTSDILMTGSRFVSALPAGGSSPSATTAVIAPKTVPPGTYYVCACADASNQQPEANETNNCLVLPGTITVIRQVDLVMTAVSTVSTTVAVNGTFTIDNTELNQGTTIMTAGSNVIKFYLSTDATITTSDKLLTGARFVSPSLAAGASSTGSTTVTVPATVAPGTYYIGAIADAYNGQPETNELNNTLAGMTITVTP